MRISVKSEDWNQQTNTPIINPITNAVVVVDGVEYPTDTLGDVWVAGIDVGLHDVHVFADGYSWISAYQYTADTAGNTFNLRPVDAGNNNNNGSWIYIPLDITLPAGTTIPQYGSIEVSFTDSYGNTANDVIHQNQVLNPKTMTTTTQNTVELQMYANITPYAILTGALTATRTSCDMYGYNCMQTSFVDIPNATLATAPAWNTATPTAITLITPAGQTAVAVTSQQATVHLDVNLINSALSAGQVVNNNQYTYMNGTFTWTDTSGNTQVAGVSVASPSTTSARDAYTGVFTTTVNQGATTASIVFWSTMPAVGTTVTGILSLSEIVYDSNTQTTTTTNYVDMGLQSFTVTEAPYINTVNTLAATATVTVTFPIVPPNTNYGVDVE